VIPVRFESAAIFQRPHPPDAGVSGLVGKIDLWSREMGPDASQAARRPTTLCEVLDSPVCFLRHPIAEALRSWRKSQPKSAVLQSLVWY